jgi:hypothetical protein
VAFRVLHLDRLRLHGEVELTMFIMDLRTSYQT